MNMEKSLKTLWFATCALGLCLFSMTARGGIIFSNLVSFSGTNGVYPGANPYCGLALGADGNLYGTTSAGGSNNLGTVFRLTPSGAFTSLLSFNGTNGADPSAALTLADDGTFYGTTFAGGVSNWGTIFRITTNGGLANVFSFTGSDHPDQGAAPASALLLDNAGDIFGTANYGGAYTNAAQGGSGYGTVFEIAANGSVTVPVFFDNTNGAHPSGGMVLGKDGNFYGTTTWGGRGLSGTFPGYGTIFRLSPDGTFTNLYKFTGGDDGGFIYAGLVQGKDGYLYGAAFGSSSPGYGTLFKISTNGDFVPLYKFSFSDSGSPYAGLMEGSDGNLYGTAYGAYAGYGSVFRLTPGGAFTNLVFFNVANGAHPSGVLVQGPDHNFYGTTAQGGPYGLGTVFRLSLPLRPVIKTVAQTNGVVTFTWSAVAGQTYQPEYCTNLVQTNWSPLVTSFVATNGVVTTTDPDAAASAQRFYRIVLLP
jgi:uncharacterized repeat protein (TIGR03803 family)